MKKVFVSVPMKRRTDEAIRTSIDKMHTIAELIFGEPLLAIDGFCPDTDCPEGYNPSVWCLGRSIQRLAEADYFIGIGYSDFFKGCNIEHQIAQQYGIKTVNLDLRSCKFLHDAFMLECDHFNRLETCNGDTVRALD